MAMLDWCWQTGLLRPGSEMDRMQYRILTDSVPPDGELSTDEARLLEGSLGEDGAHGWVVRVAVMVRGEPWVALLWHDARPAMGVLCPVPRI